MFSSNTSQQSEGYQIQRSLRFNSADSAYLNRTPASAGNRRTFTWSGWIKLSATGIQRVLSASSGSADDFLAFASDTLRFQITDSGGTPVGNLITTQVFRDYSSWYHIVVAVDTTQATASNRLKMYVNGVQVTDFSTATYPAQNTDTLALNTAVTHYLSSVGGTNRYLNGYMTEVNFIDGQALTPSSFGITNPDTGVWQPKAYTGTYGTNGFYLNFSDNSNTTATTLGKDYSRGTNLLTYSEQFDNAAWIKIASSVTANTLVAPDGTLTADLVTEDTASSAHYITGATSSVTSGMSYTGSIYAKNNGRVLQIAFNVAAFGSNAFANFDLSAGSVGTVGSSATATIQNVGNGWYRCTLTATATATTSGTWSPYLATSGSSSRGQNYTGNGYSGIYIWGAQLEAGSSAGAYTQTTAGTAPNNWTPNNFSVSAGAGNDSLVDVPTAWGTDTGVGGTVRGNYATWSPLKNPQAAVLTNGNLDLSTAGSTARLGTYTTIGVSTGKWYWEITAGSLSTDGYQIGVVNESKPDTVALNGDANSYIYLDTGNKAYNGTISSYGATYVSGDVIGVALDLDAGTLTFYKNGSSQGTAFTGIASNTWFPTVSDNSTGSTTGSSFIANFGQRPFAYTAPSGFKALCTQNLPTPTIGATASTQAGKYFNAVTYTGNGSSRSITGLGFQPDFTWIKDRSAGFYHRLADAVRGVGKELYSNDTGAETTNSVNGYVTSFDSDGFSLGTGIGVNQNGTTYVAWNWKANGAGVTNTAGSITSTVSANTTSGFSVVTYTGNASGGATIGHGLGSAPKMVIIKNRGATSDWIVGHSSLTSWGYFLKLNTTAAQASASTVWNNTAPTSTVVTLGSDGAVNGSTASMVAYCFAEVQGFSKFGSYTGNGSTDGPFVYCGFRPAYLLVKRTDTTGDWYIIDAVREGYNVIGPELFANTSSAEALGSTRADFLSNGFKLRSSGPGWNASGGAYIFAAFASAPQKFALAR